MGVTIYDIAQSADVSIATVSRVLNGSNRVADETKSRVLESARVLGYMPNLSARSLAQKKVNVVSAIVPVATSYFFVEVLRGVQDRLSGTDFDLLIFSWDRIAKVDDQIQRALHPGRSGGVLLFSLPMDSARSQLISRSDIPVVLVDSVNSDLDSYSIDNELGGRLATQHLIDCGHSKIGLIMGSKSSVPAMRRRQGYEIALQNSHIKVDDELIIICEDERTDGFDEDAGYRGMMELIDRADKLDAVFVTSDIQALGVMKAAKDRGLSIPTDVAIVGFDDILVSSLIGLTTIRQPMFEIGRQAAEQLLMRIDTAEGTNGVSRAQTVFAPELIVRETTASHTAINQ